MLLSEVYQYLNALISTESLGNDFNLREFNYLIKDESVNMFKAKVEELYANQRGGALSPEVVYASKALRTFIKEDTVVPTTGTVNLAALTSYAYFIACHTTALYNGQLRNIPLVTHEIFNNQLTNMLAAPLKKNPVCIMDADSLRIKPTNITSVVINYFRYPTTPVMDYYISALDNIVFLNTGDTRVLQTGETGSVGQTAGTTVTSTTVELEFTTDMHPEFINRLIGRLGLPKRDQILLQTSMMEKQQEEAK